MPELYKDHFFILHRIQMFFTQFYIQWQTIEISVGWFIHHVFHPKYFHNTSVTGTELFINARLY